MMQALSGLMSVTGYESGEPTRVGVPIVDIVTSLICCFSISTALHWKDRTRKGQRIEVSLLGAALQVVGQWIVAYSATRKVPGRFGNRYPLISPYETYRTKDGWLMVAVGNELQWRRLCECVGRPGLIKDRRFSTNQDRIKKENRAALDRELTRVLKRRTNGEWTDVLLKAGVPASPVNSVDKSVENMELYDSGVLVKSLHPWIGSIAIPGVAASFELSPGRVRSPAPLLGQHTLEVLRSLGRSEREIAMLLSLGVAYSPEKV